MLWAISLNRTVKKNSTKPVEPSNFLWALKQKLCNIRGVHFDFNAQQDLAEILQVVLEELKCVSLAASQLISLTHTQKKQFLAIPAFVPLCQRKNLDIITLPLSASIQTSINQFLKPEILWLQNKWFCLSCPVISESTRETSIISPAPILTIQVYRLSNQGCQIIKDANFFSCTQI